MKEDFLKELLDKYLRGECSADEIQVVEDWYHSFERDEGLLEQLPADDRTLLKNQMLQHIKHAMQTEAVALHHPHRVKPRLKTIIFSLSAIAAVLFAGFLIIVYIQNTRLSQTVHHWANEVVISNTSKAITQKTLPDGSTVWLSPGTVLRYGKTFAAQNREVAMTGDAFFDVVKNPQRPFVIYSGKVTTKVWGTSFRVNAADDQPAACVSVLTGKVSVSMAPDFEHALKKAFGFTGNTNQVMLLPGQQGIYLKAQHLLKSNKINDSATLGLWQKANVSFNNAALKNVIGILNKTFSVEISTNDPALELYHIRADFTDKNLPDILEILHLSMNIAYSISGNHIVLQKSTN